MTPSRLEVVFYAPYAGPLVAAHAGIAGAGPAGGAETQLFLVARALGHRGHRVGLAVFDEPRGLPPDFDGVEVIGLPVPGNGISDRMRFLAALFRRVDADVLVQRAAGSHTGLVGVLARLRRRRFVYSSASDFDFEANFLHSDRRARHLFPLGIRCAHGIIVQTDTQAELCQTRWHRPCTVIRSIAEGAPERASGAEAFLWIGRLAPYKSPETFAALAERLPDAQFWMIGGPSELNPDLYVRMRAAAQERPNLELLAPRPRGDVVSLLERAVAIVSTSVAEGMPNVFLEGWARGVPALAFAHDPDGIIERHEIGWFAAGSPDLLAEHAANAWGRRHDQIEMATRCRAYVASEHASERVAERWERALGLPRN